MRRALVLAVAVLLLSVVPAFAAGPFDGFYSVVETHPTLGQLAFFASVHQNNNALVDGFNVLFNTVRFGGSWTIGLALLTGDSVSGNFYDHFGYHAGTLAGSFTDPIHFHGQVFYNNGAVTTLAAQRIF